MKKKIISILAFTILAAGTVFLLIHNKKNRDLSIKELQSFEMIVPIKICVAENQEITHEIKETGTFEASDIVEVISQSYGFIENIFVNRGEFVNKGDTIAIIKVELLKEKMSAATQNLSNAVKDHERMQILYNQEAVTKRDLEAAKNNLLNAKTMLASLQKEKKDAIINAPVSGYVVGRVAKTGELVSSGLPLFTISSLNKMQFTVEIGQNNIHKIAKGDKALIYTDIPRQRELEGLVDQINFTPSLSGRYKVDIAISADKYLLPGVTGSAIIKSKKKENLIILPRTCLISGTANPSIYVIKDNTAYKRSIVAEYHDEYSVAVKEGLKEKEIVAKSGVINLSDSCKVKIVK